MTLKPLRYPQGDLFVCELTDVILKDDMASMEHPFYSISKKPDRSAKRYEHGESWIDVRPSIKGTPTIYDKDLIIYVISQIVAVTNKGETPPRSVQIDPYSFLVFTQRATGGRDYKALCDMIERIEGTRYRTNVKTGGIQTDRWFGLLDSVELQTDQQSGKLLSLTISVSDWLAHAIRQRDLLTLNPDYFRLRRPLERRLYEIGRKRCGTQRHWSGLGLDKLKKLCGSTSSLPEFRRMVGSIVRRHADEDGFPDYSLKLEHDVLRMTPNEGFRQRSVPAQARGLELRGHMYEDARRVLEGWCPKEVELQWRNWVASEKIMVKNPEKHYLSFCESYVEQRMPEK
ncbi:MAG: replication initiator protein A [Pseudomonadota bacterium]